MILFIRIEYLLRKTYDFKPIENCYFKIHHVHFNDFDILLKTLCHWKTDFLPFKRFGISFSMKTFFEIKDYSFPL